jgi:hypothetical protein
MAIKNYLIQSGGTDIFDPEALGLPEGEYAVTNIMFCNVSGADATLDLHVVENNGTASDTNKVIYELLIPAKETFTFDTEKLVLNQTDFVRAVTKVATVPTSNVVSATVSYMRVS